MSIVAAQRAEPYSVSDLSCSEIPADGSIVASAEVASDTVGCSLVGARAASGAFALRP